LDEEGLSHGELGVRLSRRNYGTEMVEPPNNADRKDFHLLERAEKIVFKRACNANVGGKGKKKPGAAKGKLLLKVFTKIKQKKKIESLKPQKGNGQKIAGDTDFSIREERGSTHKTGRAEAACRKESTAQRIWAYTCVKKGNGKTETRNPRSQVIKKIGGEDGKSALKKKEKKGKK